MKEKVCIIIDDDNDEKSTTYSVDKDGVIEIHDIDERNDRRGNPTSVSDQPSSSNGSRPQLNSSDWKNVKSLPLDNKIQNNLATSTNQKTNMTQISHDKASTTAGKSLHQAETANHSFKRKRCSSSDGSNQPGNQHKRTCTQQDFSSTSQNQQTQVSSRQVLSSVQNIPNLSSAEHILFIDLDNWKRFLTLPYPLPPKLFVLGFCGGNYVDTKRSWSSHFQALVKENRFYQHPKCGKSKNAADIALCIHASRLDLQLPKQIPFTVLSGDKDFQELKAQLSLLKRQVHLVDPHHKDREELYKSLAMTGKK